MNEQASVQALMAYTGLACGGLFVVSLLGILVWLHTTGPDRATSLGGFMRRIAKPASYKGFLYSATRYGGSFFTLYMVAAIVIGLLFLSSIFRYAAIANNYATTPGTRLSIEKATRKSETNYNVRYAYTVGGTQYILDDSGSDEAKFGATKTVAYSSADPGIAVLVFRASFYDDLFEGQIIGVFVFTIVLLSVWYLNAFTAYMQRKKLPKTAPVAPVFR